MVEKKHCIAVIPARAGSKRLPGKNKRMFGKIPLFMWAVRAAQKSACFDRIIISTDDPEIIQMAREFKIEIPFLRDRFADDKSNTAQSTLYCLEQVKDYYDEEYDIVAQLMPVCPLRTDADIHQSKLAFTDNQRTFQISCAPFLGLNPWWAAQLNSQHKPEFVFPEALKKSHELQTLYAPSGAIWFAKVDALKQTKSFYGPPLAFEPLHPISAFDIDTIEDFEMAETFLQMRLWQSQHT